MSTTITVEDVESALSLVEANGGAGDYEVSEEMLTERWLFPRFKGADETNGTCSAKGKAHKGKHDRIGDGGDEPNPGDCIDYAPDAGDMYLSRTGIGPHDTDVETVVSWLQAPRNMVGAILALGEPGTGKTALIEAAVTHLDRKMTTVVCTPDHTKDSLFLRFVGEGRGDLLDETDTDKRSPYTLGPIPYAAKHGHILYLDEFMLLVDGVKPLVYPLADGRRFLPEGNVDGSALEVHPDFRLILSSNPSVRGASLPEPVGSRCASTTITVETTGEMLRDLNIDEAVVGAWEALGNADLWRPQIREMRLADYWLPVDPGQAVSAFVPEHCPASQRERVTQMVVGFLGGDVSTDGRLIVS